MARVIIMQKTVVKWLVSFYIVDIIESNKHIVHDYQQVNGSGWQRLGLFAAVVINFEFIL